MSENEYVPTTTFGKEDEHLLSSRMNRVRLDQAMAEVHGEYTVEDEMRDCYSLRCNDWCAEHHDPDDFDRLLEKHDAKVARAAEVKALREAAAGFRRGIWPAMSDAELPALELEHRATLIESGADAGGAE